LNNTLRFPFIDEAFGFTARTSGCMQVPALAGALYGPVEIILENKGLSIYSMRYQNKKMETIK
jgi:hypothetical protein